ncbi:hypothetical protein IGI04_007808, partial [Brassica rapa subsp. trilocularis]
PVSNCQEKFETLNPKSQRWWTSQTNVTTGSFKRERDQMFKPVSDGYRCSVIAEFFADYNSKLLESSNYRTRQQAIKLMGEILLDGSNSVVMTRHVTSRDKATGVFEEIEHEEENNVEEREK